MNPGLLDGITLAYVGDSVMELYIRKKLVNAGVSGSRDLNALAQKIVNAAAQAAAFHKIKDILTEEENEIFKRGRNCGHINLPKHAKMVDYRTATGFEALLGFLCLSDRESRAIELLDIAVTLHIETEEVK